MTVNHSDSLNLASEITVDLWLKADTLTAQNALIRKGLWSTENIECWGLDILGGHIRFFIYDNSGNSHVAQTKTTINTNLWYNITETYDGENIKVYINGNESASLGYSGAINTNVQQVFISKHTSATTNYFIGTIDEIRIYNGVFDGGPPPILELPTIILFGISIFGIVGYIGYRRFRHDHVGIS